MKSSRCKKIKKSFSYILLIIFCVAFISSEFTRGDVGNNNRYDESSGSSSWSGSSSGSSWSSSDGYHSTSNSSSLTGSPIELLIILIVVATFITIVVKAKKQGLTTAPKDKSPLPDKTNDVSLEIQKIDPNFSKDKFLSWTREVFVKLQQAWSERNWKTIRPFESEELFAMHNSQLEEYIKNNKINKVEKINVNYTALTDFRIDGDKEIIDVELHAIMRDYVVDATTNQVLESDPTKDWHMQYIMTFMRKKGVKTKEGLSNKSTTNCPNCGAPTEITSSGQCPYCKSVITTGEHDWVLTDIRAR